MRSYWAYAIALFAVLAATSAIAGERGGPALILQINETMAQVRSGKTVDARRDAAEHLARLAQGVGDKEVTQSLVTDITSLLDVPDDSVRFYVAVALGNLGPTAKSAAPKLKRMLYKADCDSGVITLADGIRYALKRMGIEPPAERKCGRIAG
jgi:hypothetical protein